jgi:formamidopyrimidine-DNA glycosylase
MPELPEVETIVRDLAKYLPGKTIKEIKVLNKKTFLTKPQSATGRKINRVWRRGKQVIIDLAGDKHLIIHLKMTGQLIWQDKKKLIVGGHPITGVGQILPNKFTRVIFKLSNGGQLFFNDVRKFGYIKLVSDQELESISTRLGLEPLTRGFNDKKLKIALAKQSKAPGRVPRPRAGKIKPALLDQTKVVGIGNIYADESLWLAKILPTRTIASLKDKEWTALAKAIVKVLRLSIAHRGTSFSDYRDAQGSVGNFIKKLKVYGRHQEACRRCRNIIKKAKLGGRGTHWCEKCQK